MLWRIRIVWRSVRRFGIRATWVALGARAHGAIQKIGEFADLSRLVSERQPTVVLEIGTIDCDGFEVETLLHLHAHRAGLAVVEVPSYEEARISGASNLRPFRDGLRILATILRERHKTNSSRDRPAAAIGEELAERT
jgi:hypothetical protein